MNNSTRPRKSPFWVVGILVYAVIAVYVANTAGQSAHSDNVTKWTFAAFVVAAIATALAVRRRAA
jgi:uncharacterized membrane protein YhaH (DUF805 family)